MRMYYQSTMKEEADRCFAANTIVYERLSEEEKANTGVHPRPVALRIRLDVAEEFWKMESTEVKEKVLAAIKEQHEENIEELEKLKEILKTPAQYHQ
jgi:hypothetical protein